MKKKVFKFAFTCLACSLLFVALSYAYITGKTDLGESTNVEKTKTDEPYTGSAPLNCGVMFCLPDDTGILFYLDFLGEGITVLSVEELQDVGAEYKGYSIDYHIYGDYNLISGVIDRIGGIEVETDGETVRLSGVQATEALGSATDKLTRYKIIKSTFDTVSQNGLSRNDLIYIIDNCDSTELSISDCFNWTGYLKAMCGNINIIA